ncbi:MAG: hypothetical protein Q4C20_13365, partial [Erysipelotrichaceae bacterium]|nr:hypothetical protein [Erysipelotrichaceae bacterium]
MSENNNGKKKAGILAFLAGMSTKMKAILAAAVLAIVAGAVAVSGLLGPKGGSDSSAGTEVIEKFWPDAFVVKANDEPPFEDDPSRTNNAFNVIDFGAQGSNGWFYRYGDYKKPQRSLRAERFDGEKYTQAGANGFEIKNNFVHTANGVSPILEWRAAENGKVNVTLAYVKNVNGDANPSYPDGVQLLVYKGEELLKLEIVPISVTEENFALIEINDLEVKELESLYFVVNPCTNNAYDGGSLYAAITDVSHKPAAPVADTRTDNNANSTNDFGEQGSNGWRYMYGNDPSDLHLVSHEHNGEYLDAISPALTIKKDFIHPSLNHNAVLGWQPAVSGTVDVRLRYTKFEQNDGNPDFPDGTRIKIYKNGDCLYNEHVDVKDDGEILIKKRIPTLAVTPLDMLYFMVDAEGNSSYDGGALDVTIVDINGTTDENAVNTETDEIRQNFADVKDDFGPQGSNGWIFQSGYGDDPFNARNMAPFDKSMDRYFSDNWLEIKRDYVNTGEHDSSAVIKWRVAQNGVISIRASYTKMKNEDKNPDWPDGTRVSLYADNTLLARQTFAPYTDREETKRLDIPSLSVRKGQYITMVVCGIDNNAYDGGKYEFAINSLSGLVGNSERNVPASYETARTNFASVIDDFGAQGYNGWYYQYGYNHDPFCAVNVEKCENGEKYYTNDGIEIKKDYIVPAANGKCAIVKWVAAETGRINIDLLYTKLKNEDGNPSWPDGVTVYLMKNGTVLKQQYFAPLTDREVTGDLSTYGVAVSKGDCISMIVDPGENAAYDGGKYLFVIEDADRTPTVAVGNNDNNTSLAGLSSIEQGTDGWWFLEGTSPADAKVLTKKIDNGTGYGSRRAEGLVMKKDFVHTGSILDPIYQWLPGQNGRIDITGTYMKFGEEDSNPAWPDGVTVKLWLNDRVIFRQKVNVKHGDGNNNVIPISFEKLNVRRGDKLSFQICADNNYAWDGGRLAVAIEPSSELVLKPGNDNRTTLASLSSIAQGTDGWYFMEGTSLANAKPLTQMNADKTAYISVKDEGLEMKKDYVHTGSVQNPIYRWVVRDDGEINVSGKYVKFGQNDANPSYPDGITLTVYHNNNVLVTRKVNVRQGDGNDNVFDFRFDKLAVKANDIISFRISPDGNNAWDAGSLSVTIGDAKDNEEVEPDPDRTNNTVLKDAFGRQGNDGWYFGMCDWDSKNFEKLPYDVDNNRYYNNGKPELKADFVEPGSGRNAAYKWVAAKDGTIYVKGEYVKFANNADPNADGTTVRIFVNGEERHWMGNNIKGNFSDDRSETFDVSYEVKAGDEIIFAVNPEGNDSYDGGRLAVTISDHPEEEKPEDLTRTNNTVLKDAFGAQGSDGWHYGMCDWDSKNFTELEYDEANARYYNNGKPELKADFVEPGNGRNAAYKWIAARNGKIYIKGEYVKFANSEDPDADGTCVRIFLNGNEKKWIGSNTMGNFAEDRTETFDVSYDVKAGDEILFAVNPESNDSYDGGRLSVTISDTEETEPDPDRTNNTDLKEAFG